MNPLLSYHGYISKMKGLDYNGFKEKRIMIIMFSSYCKMKLPKTRQQ